MKELLVIELDDTRVRVLGCIPKRSGATVTFAKSFTLGEGDPVDRLPEVLAQALGARDRRQIGVLLAISDRRIVQGFVHEGQRPAPQLMPQVLRLAAQRVGMFSEGELLTIGYSEKESARKDRAWSAAFEAAPRPLVESYLEALTRSGATRVWLTSIESLLASGLALGPEPVAIVDVRSERARVLLARQGAVLASRKMRLSYSFQGSEGSLETIAPLCGEIKRSLLFFEEARLPKCERVLLIGNFSAELLADATWNEVLHVPVERVQPIQQVALPEEFAGRDSWSVVALGASGPSRQSPFLIEPAPMLRRHMLKQLVAQPVCAALVVLGGLHGWQTCEESKRVDKEELAERRVQVADLTAELERLRASHEPPAIVADRRAILADQQLRVPVSRMCAMIARGPDAELKLSALSFDGSRLALEGVITAKDPLLVVRCFGELDRTVRDLPIVKDGGGKLGATDGAGVKFEYWAECDARRKP